MNFFFKITILTISFSFGILVKPVQQDLLNYTHVLFEWEQEPNAYGYNLQVSSNNSFSNLILDIDVTHTVYIDTENFTWNRYYYWRVRPISDFDGSSNGEWIGTSFFSIGQNTPPYINDGDEVVFTTDIYQNDVIQDGYIAVGAFNPRFHSFIIDKYGNEIWNDGLLIENGIWSSSSFIINYINKCGNIFGFSGLNQAGMKINSDSDVVWSTNSLNPVDMHEFKQIPNGNFMGFQNVYEQGPIPDNNSMTADFQSIGYQADGETPEFPWFGQKIVEWNHLNEVVWTWNPFDYFDISDYDNLGGTWFQANLSGEHDWLHANAFHFDESESVIYVSYRHLSRITKIAYPSGEVIWNMGLSGDYINSGNQQICTELGFSYQHNVQLLDDGDLLFFDNGNLSQIILGDSNPTTRIRRIKVVDDAYCNTVWEYELSPELYSSAGGSVQLLENGNYLINTLGTGSIFEVTPSKEIIWKHTSNISAWYRAYKIPSIHPNAFSVIADNFTLDENEKMIKTSGNSITFSVANKSEYSMSYRYIFSDLSIESEQIFSEASGVVNIEPQDDSELTFHFNNNNEFLDSEIKLSIWPDGHQYAKKELIFSVLVDRIMGDLNFDATIDILDIVILVNTIINDNYNLNADINNDDSIDVLDVVQVMNIILSN